MADALTGKCVCGAVSYKILTNKESFSACHCSMCRRWSGGVFMGVAVPEAEAEISGAENLTIYKSSDWAERAFCKTCGSNLYYRITADGPYKGEYHFGAGTLDDHGDLALNLQLYIDAKPKAYDFAQKTKDMTKAEVEALFGG